MPKRLHQRRPLGTIRVEIEGTDLPGRRCGPDLDGIWYENIDVGFGKIERQSTASGAMPKPPGRRF